MGKGKMRMRDAAPLIVMGGIFLMMVVSSITKRLWQGTDWLVYSESLDKTAVVVNGQGLTLRDMAFYIAYDEMIVEEQAQIYDATDTTRYWNLKTNDVYIRQLSKKNVMKKAVHDEIFYQLAVAEKMELSEEEERQITEVQETFQDNVMTEAKLERMGVSQNDINASIRKIGIAQKYQSIYAEINQYDMEELEIEGEAYNMMLADYRYWINDDVWDRVNYGDVTLVHKNGVFQEAK